MSVRAKFKLDSYETSLQIRRYEKDANGRDDYQRPIVEELRTLKLSPVSDGSAENKEFWHWTPSGQISIGVVNQAAWSQFKLGKSYYVDFTEAE